mmetsp:Transcript_20143/g.64213  ORF Transcript_20143/g.64213 Transcript_20143/m.64213 type:complete len:211 (+) Transcript_20143:880-1512(+)
MAFSALLSPSASPCLFVSCRSPSIRGDFHGCPPAFGWRSRYGCVNLNVAVALPVPAVVRASARVIGSVSVVPSCPAVALSARAVRDFVPPACRPSVSPPSFVVIIAIAKALRSLDSLAYPLRCVIPVYILILCARCRSLPLFIVVASVDCGAASSLASVLLVSPAIVPCLLVLAIALAVVYLFIVSPAAGGIAVGFLSSPFLPAPLAVWC